jgi:hypothetical protein
MPGPYARGSGRFSWLTGGAAAVLFAGLLAVQVWSPEPFLVRSSLEQEARTLVIRELQGMPEGFLASADVRFTRADIPDQSTLLIVLHVQRRDDNGVGDQELGTGVVERVRRAIDDAGMNVTPLVDVTVLDAP